MKNSDLIIALTKMSLAHTKARLDACNLKSRYLIYAVFFILSGIMLINIILITKILKG